MIKQFISLLCAIFLSQVLYAQKNDSTGGALSEWHFRLNPSSFFEPVGGVHVGIETNLDKRKKYYVITEYGYIFINNTGSKEKENRNNNRISGFEGKLEIRKKISSKRSGTSFLGVEAHFLNAGINNSGWFSMGTPDPSGLYPYLQYQYFRESITSQSIAGKYVWKFLEQENKWNIEFFGGLGFIYSDITYKNADGKLTQADFEPKFNMQKDGIQPYIAIGGRLLFKLK